jgi:hypothetical protein
MRGDLDLSNALPAAGVLENVAEAAPAPDNAILEGGAVPVGLSELYRRVDDVLIPRGNALVAIEYPRPSHAVDVEKRVFECELREGGTVRVIGLEQRARELHLLEPFETVMIIWT